ncbi:hypothetical protein KKC13_05740 [bacterium]|nr:hypothetical protein [bacterium]MBU1957891.1 hypothetical protein [bacterium]
MRKQFRQGIAMIELIFALVIIGITLLSAPMLIQQSIASSNVGLQQEAIAAIASHTGIILSSHWDEADANISNSTASILSITRTPPLAPGVTDPFTFDISNTRAGMKNIFARTTLVGGELAPPSLTFGFDTNDSNYTDDVDDYHGAIVSLTVYNNEDTTVSTGDYVDKDLNLTTIVTYADDITTLQVNTTANDIFNNRNITGQSNIKFITTRLTTNNTADELEKDITLHAFSCNIGTFLPKGEEEFK